jgi:hypothetical protein
MAKISHFFLEPSWRGMMKTTHHGKKSSPLRKKKPIPPQLKKTQ